MTVTELKKILEAVEEPDRTIVFVNVMPSNRFHRVIRIDHSDCADEAGTFPTLVVEINE